MSLFGKVRIGWLCAVLTFATGPASAESLEQHRQRIVPGQTSQQEVRQLLGQAPETIEEADVEVWVYNDKIDIPMLVSVIPIVGDIADAVALIQNIRKNHELVIQFAPDGIVRKAKLREMD
jgi:hypothetical protein